MKTDRWIFFRHHVLLCHRRQDIIVCNVSLGSTKCCQTKVCQSCIHFFHQSVAAKQAERVSTARMAYGNANTCKTKC